MQWYLTAMYNTQAAINKYARKLAASLQFVFESTMTRLIKPILRLKSS